MYTIMDEFEFIIDTVNEAGIIYILIVLFIAMYITMKVKGE